MNGRGVLGVIVTVYIIFWYDFNVSIIFLMSVF